MLRCCRRRGRSNNRTPHPLPRGFIAPWASRRSLDEKIVHQKLVVELHRQGRTHLYAEQSSERQIVLVKSMKRVTECVVLMIALTALAQPAQARSYLNCSTRKVVMISTPSGDTSSTKQEDLGFSIDDAAKTLMFSDNRPLTVTRLDRSWISANRDGIFYEFDRQDGTLTYASSTTQDSVTTTIVGSGRCEISPTPTR